MTTLKPAHFASSLILLTGFAVVAFGQEDRYSIQLNSSSGYSIREVYVSSSENRSWDHDLLGSAIVPASGSFTVTNIPAGEDDIRLIDENGYTCDRRDAQFFQNRTIDVTRDWLLGCEVYNPAYPSTWWSGLRERFQMSVFAPPRRDSFALTC